MLSYTKKILLLFIAIIFIIFISGVYISFNKDDKTEYIQNIVPSNGSFFVITNQEFDIPFMFIDENEFSQLSSTDNIENISIVASDEKLEIESFSLDTISAEESYTIRNLQVICKIKASGNYKLETITIEFVNNTTKTFPIGNLYVSCNDETYYNDIIYAGCNIDAIPVNKNMLNYNDDVVIKSDTPVYSYLPIAIDIYLEAYDDFIINNIQLGNEQYSYNVDDIIIEFVDIDSFDHDARLGNIKTHMNQNDLNQNNNDNKNNLNFKYSKENGVLEIYIPVSKTENEISMSYFNIVLEIVQNNENKKIFNFNPTVSTFNILDEKNILNLLEKGK